MAEMFKLSDIKAGYLLEVTYYDERLNMTVMPSKGSPFEADAREKALGIVYDPEDGSLGCCCPGSHWWPLAQFTDADNLRVQDGTAQIEAVYGYTANRYLLDNSPKNRELLWRREDPAKVKKQRFLSKFLQKFRKNAN